MFLQQERAGGSCKDLLCHCSCLFSFFYIGQQHQEFIAADARDRVFLAHALKKPFGDFAQQHVADVMAERVVDVLEVIQIHVQQRYLFFAAHRHVHCLRQSILQQPPVGKPRHAVVVGELLHLLLGVLAFRDVGGDAVDVQRPVMLVGHQPALAMEPARLAVAADDAVFSVVYGLLRVK